MKLQEIFNQLTYGELAQVSIGGGEVDNLGVHSNNYPIIIAHINLGLSELYKRFSLRTEIVTIRQDAAIKDYKLHVDFAVSNTDSVQPTKYLIDSTSSPFESNIIKIEQVQVKGLVTGFYDTREEWIDVGINNANDPDSVFIRKLNTISVDTPVTDKEMRIVCRASHPILDSNMIDDPEDVELDFDYSHLNALLLFVASRVHNNLPSLNGVNEGNTYMSKYEAECRRLENLDLEYKSNLTEHNLDNNNWA